MKEKQSEIKKQKTRLEHLKELNDLIESKKEKMKVYDKFLTDFIKTNADESIADPFDVVLRYKTLKLNKDLLKEENAKQNVELNKINDMLVQYNKESGDRLVQKGTAIASKQK